MLEFFGVNATSIALQGAVLHICHLMLSLIPNFFINLKGCCTDLLGLTRTTCLCLYIKRSLGHFLRPPRLLKSAFFNARSVNNKAVTLSDIIVEKNWTFYVWLKHGTSSRMFFFLTNLLLLATGYLISRDPLVEVGVPLCCIINNTV